MKPTDLDALAPEFDRCEVVIRGETVLAVAEALREAEHGRLTLFGREWDAEYIETTVVGLGGNAIRLRLVEPNKIDMSLLDRLKA